MAVPFRRTSKRTKRLRRTHYKLTVTGLTTCPNCGETIKSHHVCPKCGFYNGKQILVNGKFNNEETKKAETKKTTKKAKKAE